MSDFFALRRGAKAATAGYPGENYQFILDSFRNFSRALTSTRNIHTWINNVGDFLVRALCDDIHLLAGERPNFKVLLEKELGEPSL